MKRSVDVLEDIIADEAPGCGSPNAKEADDA